jgi:hypothetical protein
MLSAKMTNMGTYFQSNFFIAVMGPFVGERPPRRLHAAAEFDPRGKYTCKPTEIHG